MSDENFHDKLKEILTNARLKVYGKEPLVDTAARLIAKKEGKRGIVSYGYYGIDVLLMGDDAYLIPPDNKKFIYRTKINDNQKFVGDKKHLSQRQRELIEGVIKKSPEITSRTNINIKEFLDEVCFENKTDKITSDKDDKILNPISNSISTTLTILHGLYHAPFYTENGCEREYTKDKRNHLEFEKALIRGHIFEDYCNQLFENFELIELATRNPSEFTEEDNARDAVYEKDGERFNIDFKFRKNERYPVLAGDVCAKVAQYHNLKIKNGGTPVVVAGTQGQPFLPRYLFAFPVPDLSKITKDEIELTSGYGAKKIVDKDIEARLLQEGLEYCFLPEENMEYMKPSSIEPFEELINPPLSF